MDNFDLKKYLAENKLLKEGFQKPEEDSNIESLKKRYWSETPEDLETIASKQDSKVWIIGSPEFDADAIQLGDYIKFPMDSQPTLVFKADEKSVNADYDSAEYSKYNRSLLNKMNREFGNFFNILTIAVFFFILQFLICPILQYEIFEDYLNESTKMFVSQLPYMQNIVPLILAFILGIEFAGEKWHYKMPVFGYRINDFTYITDAKTIAPAEIEKVKGTKVLIVNALHRSAHISHFNLDEALAFIALIQPERAYLTHISHLFGKHHEIEESLPENVFIAYDGLEIEL